MARSADVCRRDASQRESAAGVTIVDWGRDDSVNPDTPHEAFHDARLARRRWDVVCAAIMILPLALMAFQGDIVQGVAERFDRQGASAAIRKLSVELRGVEEELKSPVLTTRRAAYLQDRKSALELEIRNLREPMKQAAAAWNFSAVKLWPLVLLLGPLVMAAIWYRLDVSERQALYEGALSDGSRNRGLIVALAAMGVFWLGGWRHSVLVQAVVAHQGDAVPWRPGLWMELSWLIPVYLSLVVWSWGFVYAYAGRAGVRRVWLPGAVCMGLMILGYGTESGSWVSLWDTHSQWGYGYLIGPVAAMLFYFLLLERTGLVGKLSGQEEVGRGHEAGVLLTPATTEAVDPSASFGPRGLLTAWGLVGVVLGLVALAGATHPLWVDRLVGGTAEVAEPIKMVLMFWYVPLVAGGAALALGLWLRWASADRGDVAVRLAGLALVIAAALWRWHAGSLKVRYFADIKLIAVVLGSLVELGGWRVGRVGGAPVLVVALGVPRPERYYVAMALRPQRWAAIMAERFMHLCGYDLWREGNKLIMDPATGEGLTVADECSGLRILFAFVALSVVYAYLSPRPAWRRAVIVLSSVPIAVFCNFVRVSLMALLYRWGFKEIAHGMTHELAGFAMLPLAFLLLWAEMRALDGIERIADWVAADPSRKGRAASGEEVEP